MKTTESTTIIPFPTSAGVPQAEPDLVRNEFIVCAALECSKPWSDKYNLTHHAIESVEFHDAQYKLVTAQLQWILEQGRLDLREKISEEDFLLLCNTFQDALATPYDTGSLAGFVAATFGVAGVPFPQDSLGVLLTKLTKMSAIQKLALRDLVQQYCYPDEQPDSIGEFLRKNRLITADA